MNASYQASLVNRHKRRFTGFINPFCFDILLPAQVESIRGEVFVVRLYFISVLYVV